MASHRRLHPLPVLLLLFGLLVLLHNWATPIFEAPDEAQHYAYVRWIVGTRTLPPLDDDRSGAAQEVAQPPLYYLTAALLTAPLDDGDLIHHLWHNPGFGYQAPITRAEDKNMLVHPAEEFRRWEGGVRVVHLTRLVSLLFGLMTVAAAWGLGWEAFGSRQGALATAAMVALQPQFIFISSVVSNDAAAAATATLALWLMARLLRRGLSTGGALMVGLAVGAAAASKTSNLPLALLAAAAMGWGAWQARREGRTWRGLIAALALFGAAALLVGAPWYLRNWTGYGDPLGLTRHVQTLWHREQSWTGVLTQLPTLWRTFWGAYGWGHIGWPLGLYWLLAGLALPPLLWAARRMGRRCDGRSRAIFLLALAWGCGVFLLLLDWMHKVEAPHGRLLFPVLGAWALWMALGLERHPRWRRALLTTMAGLAALAPGARLLATFAPPRLLDETAIARYAQPFELRYGGEARLVGVALPDERIAPGDELRVRLCWEALRPMTEDYTIFVHLLGPENGIVAARHTWPGNGRYPTSLWEVGHPFCDDLFLHVPPDADAPMRYLVEAGLFEAEGGRRLEAFSAEGRAVEPPVVGSVVVAPPRRTPPPPRHSLDAVRIGDRVALLGYDAPATVSAGGTLTVTLHWKALAPPGDEWIAFVHLWREGDPQPLAQDDAPPREGWFPTSLWQQGDLVLDRHRLRLPDDLPPGVYPLWAGLYRAEDGHRLPATQEGTALPYDLVPLGEIEVVEP